MTSFNRILSAFALFFIINLTTAIPGLYEISEISFPPATEATAAPSYITQVRSSTEFGGACGQEAPAATLLLSITISTITTIQPVVTTYPATIVQTVITEWTLRYEFYYTESADTSDRSGFETQVPTTTILLGPPNVTPAVNAPAVGTLCLCPSQTAHNITICGAICCLHTWYPGSSF